MRKEKINIAVCLILGLIIAGLSSGCQKTNEEYLGTVKGVEFTKKRKIGDYWVYTCPTPNVHKGKNSVEGIILHHTACASCRDALNIMTGSHPKGKVSCHVVIDTDGTRYILAEPEAITWHAGFSRFKNRNNCNKFTVGIEFQGNTCQSPLTDAQIKSAIDYCRPIMKKYNLKPSDIVTHEMIRKAYLQTHPHSKTPSKPDITQTEYKRFIDSIQSNSAR